MKLYNTLTRTIDEVQPQQSPKISIYTCGPTVYDYPHIGNWFTFLRYDILVRTLKASGLEPKWVMNITDVGHLVSDADEGEDKLEKGAKREGKTAWDVAKFYGDYFVNGLTLLNMTMPDELPKATEHIVEQIDLIKTLQDKGYAYKISDGIYFDTSKFAHYGELARLDIEKLKAGARVAYNEEKRNVSDFALWKFSLKGQSRDMEWDSPWGKGFPGWHIECSAMSRKYLGETLDIHAGGIDHIPVHHTNEIAQSEAATGLQFARHWMHANHITVNGQKISKSLGNGITLEEIESKGFTLMDLRMLVLESHYRSQAEFTWEILQAARNRLLNFKQAADMLWQPIAAEKLHDFTAAYNGIVHALQNDLSTPEALSILGSTLQSITEQYLHPDEVPAYQTFLESIDQLTGLNLAQTTNVTDEQKKLLIKRQLSRDAKDWKKSDDIRDELKKQGIEIRDTATEVVWYRISIST